MQAYQGVQKIVFKNRFFSEGGEVVASAGRPFRIPLILLSYLASFEKWRCMASKKKQNLHVNALI